MVITVTDVFTALPYTEGTIENLNRTAKIELADSASDEAGLKLRPGEKFIFNQQLYVRSDYAGCLAVVLTSAGGSGGDVDDDEIATDSEVDEMIDDVFD